ncbi:MAG: PmoA family protein [Planctomycetota bacterium]|nr:PmoA family protein [Planctomycetota bacterium]
MVCISEVCRLGVVSLVLGVGSAMAQELARFAVEIDPGEHDRAFSTVTAELEGGRHFDGERLATSGPSWAAVVRDAHGEVRPAQAEARRDEDGRIAALLVHWVEERLAAKTPRTLVLELSPDPQRPPSDRASFRLADEEDARTLLFGERAIWRHEIGFDPERIEGTYKTFHHLLDGETVLTKGPGGLYPHHRGLFVGWSQTRSGGARHNFWWNADGAEHHQRHAGFVEGEALAGTVRARSVSRVEWTSGGDPIVVERRRVSTWSLGAGRWAHDFDLTLRGVSGEVRLDGDPAHAGFQFRAAQEVAEREDCTYVLPASATGGENDTWSDCPWAAGHIFVGGRAFWIVHMDAPSNPRPTVYNTRSYGRFGAFFRATIPSGEELSLRYRVLVMDAGLAGELERADFERAFAGFAAPLSVVVKNS